MPTGSPLGQATRLIILGPIGVNAFDSIAGQTSEQLGLTSQKLPRKFYRNLTHLFSFLLSILVVVIAGEFKIYAGARIGRALGASSV